jgi:hypothetical protein
MCKSFEVWTSGISVDADSCFLMQANSNFDEFDSGKKSAFGQVETKSKCCFLQRHTEKRFSEVFIANNICSQLFLKANKHLYM